MGLIKRVITRWVRKRCGLTKGGHAYDLEVLGDEESFTLEPLATCKHCGLMLPDWIYEKVAQEIKEVMDAPRDLG